MNGLVNTRARDGERWIESSTRDGVLGNFDRLVKSYTGHGLNCRSWNGEAHDPVDWKKYRFFLDKLEGLPREWINSVRYEVKLRDIFKALHRDKRAGNRRPRCRVCGARPSVWLDTDHAKTPSGNIYRREGWNCTGRPSDRAKRNRRIWAERQREKWEESRELALLGFNKATTGLLNRLSIGQPVSVRQISKLLTNLLKVIKKERGF